MTDQVWYYAIAGNRQGPVSDAELRGKIESGEIKADTLVWYAGMTDWTKAGEVPGLIAPGQRTASPPALAGAAQPSMPLVPKFGTWALFGRALLVVIGDLLIIPAPWVNTYFYRWYIDQIELPNGGKVQFEGKPGDLWYVFIAMAVFFYLGQLHIALQLVSLVLTVLFYFLIIQWVFANLSWQGQTERLRFTGSLTGMFGYAVLNWLGFVLIILWAWVQAWTVGWICDHVEGTRTKLSFDADGLSILWRTVVFVIACVLVIPIPWALAWFMRWYTAQFHLSARA